MKLRPPDWKGLAKTLRSRDFLVEAGALLSLFGLVMLVAFLLTTRMLTQGEDAVVIEDLTGRDAGDAAVWLAEKGLRAEIDHFENNDTAVPLSVTFHSPGAGEEVRPGHVVRLTISRGARNVPVPDVRNAYRSQASLILSRNGLVVSDVIEVADPAPANTVLATSPGPNASVLGGTPVKLLVSRGPAKRVWIMPEVTWSGFDTVSHIAEEMGVMLQIGQRMHHEDEPENVVLEQFPAPGTRIVEGEPLRVTVNGDIGAAPAEGGAHLVDLLVQAPKGFVMHRVEVRVIRGTWTRTLYEDLLSPGDHVRVVAAVLPGDRVVATMDGVDVLVRRF